jgi:protein ImuB
MTRWLCVHLPFYRTERITRASPTTPGNPVAVVEMRGDSVMLVAASPSALSAGVRPGMTATAARSLVPTLRLTELSDEGETADFEALAAAMGRFTPRVCLDQPSAILLEISGCERLFGSESELERQAIACVGKLGYTTRTGLAANPTAAYALAIGGEAGQLEVAPVSALRLPDSDLQHLEALGVRTVGELCALPMESLPARFSGLLVKRLRQVSGDAVEDFPAFRQPEVLSERLDFIDPTERRDALMFAFRRVAVALEERLEALAAGALSFEATLRGTDGAPVTFSMVLSRPTRDSRSLASLLLGRLEGTDTGDRWFDGIEVRVPTLGPIHPPQRELFGERDLSGDRSVVALVDELTGRLGPSAVVSAEMTFDPRPERSFTYYPFAPSDGPAVQPAAVRPLTIFDPHKVSVECDEAGHPVRWHEGRRGSNLHAQPLERVHFGWWGGDAGERDYFAVQDEAGVRWWLMRRGGDWYIAGAF